MNTLQTYDELPYDRLPMPETEPDFLAALALLHGFKTADARCARVLELGCAQGGNLIPMAARYPGSAFVGIDLSRVQVEEGQVFITQAGLGNIRLLHGDIAALPDDLGEFDFIIAHGVYSWIPEFVRDALRAACRRLLKPQGVAYVSFNVEAGWKTYGQIRRVLLAQDNPALPPMQRVEQARNRLSAQPFESAALQKEAQYLLTASPSYVFHEYLSEINQPFSFTAFMQNADAQGLRYLGEAGPRRARVALDNDWGLSAETRYERWLEAESSLDGALDTRFRRALLVRSDTALPQPQDANCLNGLAFSAELSCDDELDFAEASTQTFQTRSQEKLPVSHPLLKAFLVVLSGEWPGVLDYQTALSKAHVFAREYGYDGSAEETFNEALLDFAQLHGVRLHRNSDAALSENSDQPLATALAHAQAQSPVWPVSNAFHQALDLDEWGRWLLTALDGKTSQQQLADGLAARLAKAGIEATPELTADAMAHYLHFFARQGLLQP